LTAYEIANTQLLHITLSFANYYTQIHTSIMAPWQPAHLGKNSCW